jgi:hypothetical protein
MVLAHEVGADTEKACQRSDLLDHHRLLMGTGPPIVALRAAGTPLSLSRAMAFSSWRLSKLSSVGHNRHVGMMRKNCGLNCVNLIFGQTPASPSIDTLVSRLD